MISKEAGYFFLYCMLTALAYALPFKSFSGNQNLSLQSYLAQVKEQNLAILKAKLASRSLDLREDEGGFATLPKLFAESELQSFNNVPNPITVFSKNTNIQNQSYQTGIEQNTRYGVNGKIYYNYQKSNINNLLNQPAFTNSSPIFELTVPLLRNRLGAEIRAEQHMICSQNHSKKYLELYKIDNLLVEAEMAYWRLALTRRMSIIHTQGVEQSKALVCWIKKRMPSRLAEETDLLEAEADLANHQLLLQQAIELEKNAAYQFNLFRNSDNQTVHEVLISPNIKLTGEKKTSVEENAIPQSYYVKAISEESSSEVANMVINTEKLKPVLDIYARYSVNPENPLFNQFIAGSFAANYPNTAVGLRLTMPIDFTIHKKIKEGYVTEMQKARTMLIQANNENKEKWLNYHLLYQSKQAQFALAKQLSVIQHRKVLAEKEKYKLGKTTTYQVILVIQDYENAQLRMLNVELELLLIQAQLTHLWDSSQ